MHLCVSISMHVFMRICMFVLGMFLGMGNEWTYICVYVFMLVCMFAYS